ncbi:MAG: polyprenyl synthetase family protein [Candidatus Micrarchaeota archaeon]
MSIERFLQANRKDVDRAMQKRMPRRLSRKHFIEACGPQQYGYDVLDSAEASVNAPMWDLLSRGGKRWRPALMLLTAEAFGADPASLLDAALVPEVAHNGCLTGDSVVWMSDGMSKPIKEVQVGEEILSLGKDFGFASRTVQRLHDNGVKPVYIVKTGNRELKVTEEHPFLTARKEQPVRIRITPEGRKAIKKRLAEIGQTISTYCEKNSAILEPDVSPGHLKNSIYGVPHCLLPANVAYSIFAGLGIPQGQYTRAVQCKFEKTEVRFEWRKARDLKKGDVVLVAKNVFQDVAELPPLVRTPQNPKDRYRVPDGFTEDLAHLCGFLIGDGYIDAGRVVLCLPEAAGGRKEYEHLVERIFGAKPSVDKHGITICSKALAKMFSELGLKEPCTKKELPRWVFRLPEKHRKAFVRGYLDADATVDKTGAVRFACANEKLSRQFKFLLDSMGFVTSNIWTHAVDNTHFNRHGTKKSTTLFGFGLYSKDRVSREIGTEISAGRQRLALQRFRSCVSFRHEEEIPNVPAYLDMEKIGFNQITEVSRIAEEQTYDLQVEGTHNYVANGLIVHNTLMVDDVEDDSEMRRGKPCIHCTYGVDVAVNAGSSMYFLPLTAFEGLSGKFPDKTLLKAYRVYSQEMRAVSYGQGVDIWWHKGNAPAEVSEAQYLQMVALKTGALARMAAKLGALFAGASDRQIRLAGEFAEAVGVAFQIQDDVLNLTAGSEYGKEIGGDISEGKRTLITAHALRHAGTEGRRRLRVLLNERSKDPSKIREAIGILRSSGSIEYARRRSREIVREAWKNFSKALKPSRAKSRLGGLAAYLVEREI